MQVETEPENTREDIAIYWNREKEYKVFTILGRLLEEME